jgi:hypothetical protein
LHSKTTVDYERVLLNRLDRTIASLDQRLVLLAPPDVAIPDKFSTCQFDLDRHGALLEAVQRFRGGIYCGDGAIKPQQLAPGGLHLTPEDNHSWHLLFLNRDGGINACAWYREYDNRVYFDRLRLKQSALARMPEWRDALWSAVEYEIANARREGLRYVEVGGWAVAPESRHGGEGLLLALAMYGLGRICGGVLGITTATVRHHSSSVLCKLGGRPLQIGDTILPPYFDPQYECVMEIVRFDSRQPNPRYNGLVELLHGKLLETPVIARPYWPVMRSRGFVPQSVPRTGPSPLWAA